MDKRTLIFLAIVSGFILLFFTVIQPRFFPGTPVQTPVEKTDTEAAEGSTEEAKVPDLIAVPLEHEIEEQTKTFRLKTYDVTFSNKGAVVTSFKINDLEKDPNNEVSEDDIEMIEKYDSTDPNILKKISKYPFALHFGDYTSDVSQDLYEMKEIGENEIEFSRVYEYKGVPFTVKKIFEVVEDEYIINLSIELENSKNEYLPKFDGLLYTLEIGPQIGPSFEKFKPDDRSDHRKFMYWNTGLQNVALNGEGNDRLKIENGGFTFVAIDGKYYSLIASTNAQTKRYIFDSRNDWKLPKLRSAIYLERKFEGTSKRLDEYTIYIGPKKKEILAQYTDKKFDQVIDPGWPIIGWIAELLKYPLDFFAGLTGNYGIAIIIMTILIKVLLYPLTKKGQDSMKRMQTLNPQIAEIREKYKADPAKVNAEIAELYKREKISPLGGCLPQLLQLPIMFAFYQLFSNHFALKGAPFFGWITDLSAPEKLFDFPEGFVIPFLEWDALRLLPFIMLGTQLLSTLTTQTQQSATADNKMKYLPFLLMGVFFFILYNLPSGLVLYWTVQNFLTVMIILIRNLVKERKFSFSM